MKTDRKGNVMLKVLVGLALVLLIIAIKVPGSMWKDQAAREELARKRMMDMNDCQIAYSQETGNYEKDLKKVYEYVSTHTMPLGAPEMEMEILAVDTTSIRIGFSDIKHVVDLNTVRVDGQELVGLPGKVTRPNEHHFYCGNGVNVDLKMRDDKLGLFSEIITLSSADSLKAVAIYKNEKETFWEFASKAKINIVRSKTFTYQPGKKSPEVDAFIQQNKIVVKKSADGLNEVIFLNPEQQNLFNQSFSVEAFLQEAQNVNMARYLLSDVDQDKEPYLCPSTKDPFVVDYNLSGRFFMKLKFFNAGKEVGESISKNEKVKNYFVNIVKLKADRKVTDLVREKMISGDSTLNKQEKKDELFAKYFTEFLQTGLKAGAIDDSVSNSLVSTDAEKEQNFAEPKIEELLLNATPGDLAIKEAAKPENAKLLESILYTKKIGTVKVDVTSIKISSPINEKSTFRGYTRSFLQSRAIFGVKDDANHGFVDNGRPSWKKD